MREMTVRTSQVLCLLCLSAVAAGAQAVSFQQYDTTATIFSPLQYAGIQTIGPNGDMISTGPIYYPPSSTFPFVMLDTARNLLLLEPGTFTTVKAGAVVTLTVPTAGAYDVSGAFARANDALNAGDGVRVVALRCLTRQYRAKMLSIRTACSLAQGCSISFRHIVGARRHHPVCRFQRTQSLGWHFRSHRTTSHHHRRRSDDCAAPRFPFVDRRFGRSDQLHLHIG
jgi:hypothetical protein